MKKSVTRNSWWSGMLFLGVITLMLLCGVASATTVPFTEDFPTDAAGWRDSAGTSVVGWLPSGGPDGSAFVTTTFNFVGSTSEDTPALFRAQDEFGSSGGAFEGNWINDGVERISFRVRHDAGVPLTFFMRFADPANFPGAAAVVAVPIPSGQWTSASIVLPNPGLVFEGPFEFGDVFDNIGHVQIGVLAPAPLIGVDQTVTFDLDKVAIVNNVPTVSEWGVAAMTLMVAVAGTLVLRQRLMSRTAS